jgi:hypothetical protein
MMGDNDIFNMFFFIASDVFPSFIIHFLNIPLYKIHSFIHILVLSKEMATNSDSTTNLSSAITNTLTITDNDLADLIKIQGDLVRKLKAEKAPAEQVCYLIYIAIKENDLNRSRKLWQN